MSPPRLEVTGAWQPWEETLKLTAYQTYPEVQD